MLPLGVQKTTSILRSERTFFGVIEVVQNPAATWRALYHGTTLHGEQSTALDNGREEVYTATTRDTVLIAAAAGSIADPGAITTPGAMTVLGLLVGSFLNVVIHRLPLMLERQWRAEGADILNLPAPAEAARQAIGVRVDHRDRLGPVGLDQTEVVAEGGHLGVDGGDGALGEVGHERFDPDAVRGGQLLGDPAEPVGVIERAFHARLSEAGKRHPVTRDLDGAASDPPRWSRFFRIVDTRNPTSAAIMEGARDGKSVAAPIPLVPAHA